MWEVRALPGRLDEVVSFVIEHAAPSAQVYRADGPDPLVVVIDPTETGLPELPAVLAARPPHEWRFEPVQR